MQTTMTIRIRFPWWRPIYFAFICYRQWLGGCVNTTRAARFLVDHTRFS